MSLARIALAALALAVTASASPFEKRQIGPQTGQGTFYDVGLGACGITSAPTDYVVAVSHDLFDTFPGYNGANPNNNPICGQQASVSYNGASITVTIVDRCTGCAYPDLDFSDSAFSALADMSLGRISGVQWQLGGGGASAPPPPPQSNSGGGGCGQTYTAVSGDSCWAISQTYGIDVGSFLSMNPSVDSACSNLQVGVAYCV